MIRVSKAKVYDKLLLLDYKLKSILPYIEDNKQKLNVIMYVNNYIKDNYKKGYIIWSNFKKIGAYIIDGEELDLLYIDDKYQNKGIGSKIFKKIRGKVKIIKTRTKNKRAIDFYISKGYKINHKEKDIVYLKEE